MANERSSFRARDQETPTHPAPRRLRRGRTPLIDDDKLGEDMPALTSVPHGRAPPLETFVYTDAHGNTNEVLEGIGGRRYHYVRSNGLRTRDMSEEPTSAPVQNNRSRNSDAENFTIGLSTLDDPFSESGQVIPAGGLALLRHFGILYNAAFPIRTDDTLMPHDTRVPESIARGTAHFIKHYTQPVTEENANEAPNSKCPICLEPPTSTHSCVKIINIPDCNHLIGRECLEGLVAHSTQGMKIVCPLCRAEWVDTHAMWLMRGEQTSMDDIFSPSGRLNQSLLEESPLFRLGMGDLRLPHDNLRGDLRPAGPPPPVFNPEASSSSDEMD